MTRLVAFFDRHGDVTAIVCAVITVAAICNLPRYL